MAEVKNCKYFDPIYGTFELSPISFQVMKHKYFRRLNLIKQLGALAFVKKTATHSRFDHSVGVAHLARLTAQILQLSNDEALAVELAGLLHDIGHGPFSHTFDKITNSKHEERSVKLAGEILKELKVKFEVIEMVKHFIHPKERKMPGIEDIISNKSCELDVDKFDYLLRDGLYLGIKSELITKESIERLIKHSKIKEGTWMFHASTEDIAVAVITTRYNNFGSFYRSRDSDMASITLSDIIKRLQEHEKDMFSCADCKNLNDIKKFVKLTDKTIIDLILTKPSLESDLNNLNENVWAMKPNLPPNLAGDKASPSIALPKVVYYT